MPWGGPCFPVPWAPWSPQSQATVGLSGDRMWAGARWSRAKARLGKLGTPSPGLNMRPLSRDQCTSQPQAAPVTSEPRKSLWSW